MIMRNNNRRIVLNERPVGMPDENTFRMEEHPIPEPGPGEILCRADWLSLDPYMRGRMMDVPSYVPPVQIGEVMVGATVGEVIKSNNPAFQVGDWVEGRLGWQDFAVGGPTDMRKISTGSLPKSLALGVLGMPGNTAYFGLLDVGEARVGDTVVVSAASGAVGAVVGQIAKLSGCRVVGIAGSQDKIDYVMNDLGFDACINYKDHADTAALSAALGAACPAGIDVFFDNVGGWVFDAVLPLINIRARIVICGMISQYNLTTPEMAPRTTRHLLVKRAKMQGLIVFDWEARYPESLERLTRWVENGDIKYREDITEGLENAPAGFNRLMLGKNFGKAVVRIATE
jgi:NADPH-dependent curcumin reductase